MALPNAGITTTMVAKELGANTRDIGRLCKWSTINPWSRWKPIDSTIATMNLTELENRNYGLTILSSRTPEGLYTLVRNNGNKGYTYHRPEGIYRLGDFRTYEHAAPPIFLSAIPTSEIHVLKLGSLDIAGMMMGGTETTLGQEDVANLDAYGNPDTFFSGLLVKYGNNQTWWFSKTVTGREIPKDIIGKEVEVFEFITNFEHNKAHPELPSAANNAIFYSLANPFKRCTFIVDDGFVPGPGGGGDTNVDMSCGRWQANGEFDFVGKKVRLTIKLKGTKGGTITGAKLYVSNTKKEADAFYNTSIRGGYNGEGNTDTISVAANSIYPWMWVIDVANPNGYQDLHLFFRSTNNQNDYVNIVYFDMG